MKNKIIKFDPDELKLSKDDILEMMDNIEDRWKKEKKSNFHFIISMEAMKIGIHLMKEEVITKIWSEIVNGFNELLYENALAKAKGENLSWAETLEIVKTKLKKDAGNPID